MNPDYVEWLKKPCWSQLEILYLIQGADPSRAIDSEAIVVDIDSGESWPAPQDEATTLAIKLGVRSGTSGLGELLDRAIKAGDLRPTQAGGDWFRPDEVVRFLIQKQFNLPDDLMSAFNAHSAMVTTGGEGQREFATNLSVTGIPVSRAEAGAPADNAGAAECKVFRDMQKLTADEVSIAFVGDKTESGVAANNMLEISARAETRRVALAALGLVNRRSGRLNSQCAILVGMAQKKNPIRTEPNAAKITRLRRVFRTHLGIIGDPFDPPRKGVGWGPRFKIDDKRGAADERAKREAERRTVSYDQLTERGEKAGDRTQTHPDFDSGYDAADDWLTKNDPEASA